MFILDFPIRLFVHFFLCIFGLYFFIYVCRLMFFWSTAPLTGTYITYIKPFKILHKTANYRELFINVMIHELGHALGIPHLPPETTDLMRQVNYGCDSYKYNVCKLTDVEFEAFLRPYDPPSLETQRKFKERKKREYEKWENLPLDRCGFKKSEYNQGFDSYDKRHYYCP